ncbi:4-amino-4-deoxy-L-arabinose transferase-like glycosyltransferase [Bradyrhizobium sp. LM2.9]
MAETYPTPRFGAPREPKSPVNPGSRLVSMFDIATASHARAVGFLLVCALLLFLPGFFTIPPVDRDEARFAQATKQMVESGDYVDIRFQEDVRYKKPVGIYWLQSAAVETASALGLPRAELRIWVYRLPSLIGAIGAVLMTYWTALGFVTRRAAVLAALLMSASVLLGVEARLAKTDAMLLFCVVAAMGAMARAYLSWQRAEDETHPPWRWPAIFWTALAVGILIKGPLILMFAGLTIVALAIQDRDASWLWKLRPLWGLMWMLVLVLPWFVAIFWRAGDAFFADSVGGDMLSKLGAQESHGAPPGLYLVLFWITFWPGAPLAAMAAPAVWRARREPGAQFLLAWLVPSWIVFEAVLTKLPHYVLPLYPAIAILTVGALERRVLSWSWLMRGSAWWFAIPVAGSIIAVVGAVMLTRQPAFVAWPFMRGLADLRAVRLVASRQQPRRTLAAQRAGRSPDAGGRGLRHRAAVADAGVSEHRGRTRTSQRHLRRAEGGRGRLSRAQPRLPDRHADAAHRRFGRGGFPAAGELPFRAGRAAF